MYDTPSAPCDYKNERETRTQGAQLFIYFYKLQNNLDFCVRKITCFIFFCLSFKMFYSHPSAGSVPCINMHEVICITHLHYNETACKKDSFMKHFKLVLGCFLECLGVIWERTKVAKGSEANPSLMHPCTVKRGYRVVLVDLWKCKPA